MFKSATSYKAFLGLTLAFFFGLTLGLTLNLVNSQTSTDNRSQAANYGQLKNEYCKMTPAEAGQRYLKTCNPDISGYYGWETVSDSHAYNGTTDGAPPAGNNINRENTIKMGSSETLQNPFPANSNPKDTRCSAVQHDGDGAENGDVFVQYTVDANNYCVIYHNDYQGKTLKLNRCKLQNLNNGALTYWDNDTMVNGVQTDPALAELKNQFNQKCQPPSPTPVKPTALMNTKCTDNQLTGATNLSYEIKITDINTPGGFTKNEWFACTSKIASQTGNGLNVYNNYFGGNAMWENNDTACYRIGTPNVSFAGSATNPNPIWLYLGKKPTGSGVGSTDLLYYVDKNDNNTVKTKSFAGLASWAASNGASNTLYRLKINLWSSNGGFNDYIISSYTSPIPSNGIKINPTACTPANTATPVPSQTPLPTQSPTPPQSACTDTQIVHTLTKGDYMANIVNANTGKDFRTKTHTIDLPKADISKPVKVVADWGWTGKISGNKPQKGKVTLPGQNIDADDFWQRNEASTVSFSAIKPNNSLRSLLTLTCNDVGEKTNSGYTPFVDGYRLQYNNVWRNLRDIYPDEPGETTGDYFFCPQSTAAGWPVAVTNPQGRPDYQYSRILNLTTQDLYNQTTKLLKLQVKRDFLGSLAKSDDSIQSTDNARTAGSHYTRVTVSYCKLP